MMHQLVVHSANQSPIKLTQPFDQKQTVIFTSTHLNSSPNIAAQQNNYNVNITNANDIYPASYFHSSRQKADDEECKKSRFLGRERLRVAKNRAKGARHDMNPLASHASVTSPTG